MWPVNLIDNDSCVRLQCNYLFSSMRHELTLLDVAQRSYLLYWCCVELCYNVFRNFFLKTLLFEDSSRRVCVCVCVCVCDLYFGD
jgi:hypothetical protein